MGTSHVWNSLAWAAYAGNSRGEQEAARQFIPESIGHQSGEPTFQASRLFLALCMFCLLH